MNEQDYLFYTYTGNWNNNTLKYTENYPHSVIFHPQTHRLMHNGVIYGSDDGSAYFIKGNNANTDDPGKWTGTHPGITELKEGLSIIYVPNIDGNSTQVTLNISGLGAKNVYFNNNIPLTTQYSKGTPILLTYVIENNTGKWKHADSDSFDTPITTISSGTNYSILLSNTSSGYASSLYTDPNILKYNYSTHTLYCTNINANGTITGNLTGDVTGNASTANKLVSPVTLWGQSFDGSSNVTGDLINVGNIISSNDNTKHIGTSSNYFTDVYAKILHGKSEAVISHIFNNTTDNYNTMWLLGHTSAARDTSGTGRVNVHPSLYVSANSTLYSSSLCLGSSQASDMDANFRLYIHSGSAYIYDGNLKVGKNWLLANKANGILSLDGTTSKILVGISSLTTNYDNITVSIYANNHIIANGYARHNYTGTHLFVDNGTVIGFADTNTASTIVKRDSSSNIYANRYYTNISNESMTPTSVYVGNSTDNGIHKMSVNNFIDAITTNKPIEIIKELKITKDWMDTGIDTSSNTFPDGIGTYVIQVDATSINDGTDLYPAIYSGIMSIYYPTDNQTEVEEVLLHCVGKSTMKRLYIRTKPTTTSQGGNLKIQIGASHNLIGTYSIKFKFKKII